MFKFKHIVLLAVLCLFSLALLGADKVAEQIVKNCDEQIQKVKKAAVEKLKARQAALQKSGDENAAGEIQTMIDDLEVQGNAKTKEITFSAKSGLRGTIIGNFKKGDKITLQYVKGVWSPSKKDLKPMNPDSNPSGTTGMALLFYKNTPNVPDEILSTIPTGTQTTPFTYTFDVNCKNVSLRCNASSWNDADGEVVYKVTIEKQ